MRNVSTRRPAISSSVRPVRDARGLRTARVTLKSRYLWDVYHAGGITRDVYWQTLGERSEADTFQCLAWLYDGFALPADPQVSTRA